MIFWQPAKRDVTTQRVRGGGKVNFLDVTTVSIKIGFLPNTDCGSSGVLVCRNSCGEIESGRDCVVPVSKMFSLRMTSLMDA